MVPVGGGSVFKGEELWARVTPTELIAGPEDLAISPVTVTRGGLVRIAPYAVVWARSS